MNGIRRAILRSCPIPGVMRFYRSRQAQETMCSDLPVGNKAIFRSPEIRSLVGKLLV